MKFGASRRPTARTRSVGAITLGALLILAGGLVTGCTTAPVDTTTHDFRGTDYTRFVDNHQGPGEVFMRYPLGRIGLWSTPEGEIADSVTRGLMLYPTVDQVVDKGTANWRASISASPSQTDITYAHRRRRQGLRRSAHGHARTSPCTGTTSAMSPPTKRWTCSCRRWRTRTSPGRAARFVYVDPPDGRGDPEQRRQPGGATSTSGSAARPPVTARSRAAARRNGATSITGDGVGGYLTFAAGTPVTVAVALSMTSMARARQNFTSEFPTFDFAGAVRNLKNAWNAKLGRIEVQSASTPYGQGDLHRPLHPVREHH